MSTVQFHHLNAKISYSVKLMKILSFALKKNAKNSKEVEIACILLSLPGMEGSIVNVYPECCIPDQKMAFL